MKNKIPISWQKFHEDVRYMSDKKQITLTELYKRNSCTARQPRIYKSLGWILEGYTPKGWVYVGPEKALTDDMAAQIRTKSAELEKASDPLGLKTFSKVSQKSQKRQLRHDCARIAPENSIPPKSPGLPPDCPQIADIADTDLFAELKRRGDEIRSKSLGGENMDRFQKDLINAVLYPWASTAYLMFEGRDAFRAVERGEIKGFRVSPRIINPRTYDRGAMFDLLPDIGEENVTTLEEWMRSNPELCEQFRGFYRPENAKLASGWADVLSQS